MFGQSFLVLESSRRGRESWLLYFNCVITGMWLIMFCASFSWCHGLVCVIVAFPSHTHLFFGMNTAKVLARQCR